ncbi:MAG: DEAD/DEAH box helicase [Deltaproteobacteria bacterium]|nr:DEAD/DEAH box helicase [Deltaproteobacteria bacterium]
MLFEDLALPDPLLQAVRDLGFEKPTPIQAQALPELLKGKDIAGQAQTGTGKTACFLLGTLNAVMQTERPADGSPRALCIAPTRELAIQIARDAEQLTTYLDLRVTVCCGGLSWTKQKQELEEGTDIVVGTPGRLLDYEKRRILKLHNIQVAVVDEADRMYDMGFIDDINHLFRYMPKRDLRQSMLFSATLSYEIMRLAERHMNNPVKVRIAPEKLVVDVIEEELYHVGRHEKVNLLLGLLQREQPKRAMVFVNRKVDGEELTWRLNHNGYEAVYLSGDLPQRKRSRIIDAMKDGNIALLVATDVASRGIHVDDVTHVFNWDVPQDPEDYVHRIGRTARAGNEGKALTLADEETVLNLPAVEKMLDRKIPTVFADDDAFMPDRAGRFRRTKNVYTGWPPPSLKDVLGKDDDDDEDGDDRGDSSDGGKKRRRRRGERGPKPEASEATAASAAGDSEAGEAATTSGGGERKRRRRSRRKPEGEASSAEAAAPADGGEASASAASGDAPEKKRRRRRRGGKGGGEGGEAAPAEGAPSEG